MRKDTSIGTTKKGLDKFKSAKIKIESILGHEFTNSYCSEMMFEIIIQMDKEQLIPFLDTVYSRHVIEVIKKGLIDDC